VQSTYGAAHGSLELVAVRTDGTMQHFWRNESNFSWNAGVVFGAGVGSPPVMIQGQYGMANEVGPDGNFELCVAMAGRAQHWWRANAWDRQWRLSATFGHDVRVVTGLCQSSWGNIEVIVLRTDNRLQHYWRDGAGWHEGTGDRPGLRTPVQPTSAWTGHLPEQVELAVGETAELDLPSGAGAGNLWSAERVAGAEVTDAVVADLGVAHGAAPPPDGDPPSAADVPVRAVVRARSPGRARWRLRLARPWAPDPPVAEHELEVRVRP